MNSIIDCLYEKIIEPERLKPEMYCQCVREVYRVLTEIGLNKKEKEMICMFLEYDDIYRYIFQDILSRLDKEKAKENPVKEIERLLDIAIEKSIDIKDKFILLKRFLVFLKFRKDLVNKISEFFQKVNLDEIKMSVDDKYHASLKTPYNFGFPKYYDENEKKEKETKKGNKNSKG